jgi:hypothetical protein
MGAASLGAEPESYDTWFWGSGVVSLPVDLMSCLDQTGSSCKLHCALGEMAGYKRCCITSNYISMN